ncbi:hypothetical protein KIPB_004395 [Kipferlia bialata]|uniref:Uncharacterized protein n=1 Tax=Kipferlia bialata TaxID=797122 RepID=A0A9K3GI62_9EUKA|nr:hypothetical protein KIPB_004395 [Kipferlia bialata]|eukprot:g4395.t1
MNSTVGETHVSPRIPVVARPQCVTAISDTQALLLVSQTGPTKTCLLLTTHSDGSFSEEGLPCPILIQVLPLLLQHHVVTRYMAAILFSLTAQCKCYGVRVGRDLLFLCYDPHHDPFRHTLYALSVGTMEWRVAQEQGVRPPRMTAPTVFSQRNTFYIHGVEYVRKEKSLQKWWEGFDTEVPKPEFWAYAPHLGTWEKAPTPPKRLRRRY